MSANNVTILSSLRIGHVTNVYFGFYHRRTGFVSPYLVAVMTPHHTHAEWSLAFYVAASVLLLGGIFFLICCESKEQNWEPKEEAHSVHVIDIENASHHHHQAPQAEPEVEVPV